MYNYTIFWNSKYEFAFSGPNNGHLGCIYTWFLDSDMNMYKATNMLFHDNPFDISYATIYLVEQPTLHMYRSNNGGDQVVHLRFIVIAEMVQRTTQKTQKPTWLDRYKCQQESLMAIRDTVFKLCWLN